MHQQEIAIQNTTGKYAILSAIQATTGNDCWGKLTLSWGSLME